MRHYSTAALDCIVAIAEEGSFQGAARRLGLTQSAVSQRVHAVEEEAGAVLVVRCRPVRLTPAGELLLRYARRAQQLSAQLTESLAEHVAQPRARLVTAPAAAASGHRAPRRNSVAGTGGTPLPAARPARTA